MTHATSEAWAFCLEVALRQLLWTVCDDAGIPVQRNPGGKRVMQFWSSKSRVERIIKTVPAYSGFEPLQISWADFYSIWVPDLVKDDMLVGVDWNGRQASGYEIEPIDMMRWVQRLIEEPP